MKNYQEDKTVPQVQSKKLLKKNFRISSNKIAFEIMKRSSIKKLQSYNESIY